MCSLWAPRSAAQLSSLLHVPRPSRSSIRLRRNVDLIHKRTFNDLTRTFEEGDIVRLTELDSRRRPTAAATIQLSRLKKGNLYRVKHGWVRGRQNSFSAIEHKDIIGARESQIVSAHSLNSRNNPRGKAKYYQISYPTLADYVNHAQRRANPIYPAEAEAIVSLLDLHVPNASAVSEEAYRQALDERKPGRPQRLEILEAGSGAGGLTLQLAKAVQPANPEFFYVLPQEERQGGVPDVVVRRPSDEWFRLRGAVIHTVDIDRDHSSQARLALHCFRQGLYANNVEFHVSPLADFLTARSFSIKQGLQEPFAHIVLDLPNVHLHIKAAAEVLAAGGKLIVYAPQVTQMLGCVEEAETHGLDLQPIKFVELGPGLSRGREWTVRRTTPKRKTGEKERTEIEDSTPSGEDTTASYEAENGTDYVEGERHVWICRPEFGRHEGAGCFVGMWQKAMPREVRDALVSPQGKNIGSDVFESSVPPTEVWPGEFEINSASQELLMGVRDTPDKPTPGTNGPSGSGKQETT